MDPFNPTNGAAQGQYAQPQPGLPHHESYQQQPHQPQEYAAHTPQPYTASSTYPSAQQHSAPTPWQQAPRPEQHFTSAPYGPGAGVPASPALTAPSDDPLRPIPVVKVLSPVGVEYVFLTITLFVAAGALVSVLLTLVNGGFNFLALAFPAATLLVSVPVFAVIFLHLKRLEFANPRLHLDPSKRRSTQATQITAFIVCLFTLIGFFATVLASFGGGIGVPVGKAALDVLCVLVVAGGILFYYWRDEHTKW